MVREDPRGQGLSSRATTLIISPLTGLTDGTSPPQKTTIVRLSRLYMVVNWCRSICYRIHTAMRVELSSHVLAIVIVVTCLSMNGATYRLPDDVALPTMTHHQHPHRRQQRKVMRDGGLRVMVKPEYTVMHHGQPVHINCTATSSRDQPYISFFVSLSVRIYETVFSRSYCYTV